MAQKYLLRTADEEVTLELQAGEDGRVEVRRDGDEQWRVCELERVGNSDLYLLMIDSRPVELYVERRRGGAHVVIGRHTWDFDVGPWRPGQRARASAAASGMVRITAPMTGSIVEIRCEPGVDVAAGDVLLVMESMKMNNELRSPAAGTVETVPVDVGQRVNANDLLVALRAGEAEAKQS